MFTQLDITSYWNRLNWSQGKKRKSCNDLPNIFCLVYIFVPPFFLIYEFGGRSVFVCSFFQTNIKGLRQLNDVSRENSLKGALGANLDEKRYIPILPKACFSKEKTKACMISNAILLFIHSDAALTGKTNQVKRS